MHRHHFYLVFNPMINDGSHYKSQAHEFYSQLKTMISSNQAEEPFLYWGKLKVTENTDSKFNDFLKVIELNNQQGQDTHLYLTDFHHFWVAKVESVHQEIYNQNRTLSFYDDKDVEVWFKISDMDLISAEFDETLYYLSQLYIDNQFSSKKIPSINPYLGDLKFPMIVQDRSGENYFKNLSMENTQRILRMNPLVEQSQLSASMQSHMQSFVLSPQVYAKLPHVAKNELLCAEMRLTKDLEVTPAALYQSLASYFRILESILNVTLVQMLKDQFGSQLYVKKDGSEFSHERNEQVVSLSTFDGSLSIGAMAKLFQSTKCFGNVNLEIISDFCPEGMKYLSETLFPFIDEQEIVAKTNALKNSEYFPVTKPQVMILRNNILGVGCLGVINSLVGMLFRYEENNYLQKAS